MEKPIVAKFGGSSLANSEQFKKVKKIIEENPNRRFVVPSAPGKSNPEDTKVTDLLYLLWDLYTHNQDYSKVLENIANKYEDIAKGVGLDFDITEHIELIMKEIDAGASVEYVVSISFSDC